MPVDPSARPGPEAEIDRERVVDRPEFEDRVGSVIGDYVLEGVVGSGGMGVVYRARQGDSGRMVALKLMLPEVASNRKFRERFILEAEVAPVLDHPHIVPVFEVGETRGHLFIAMRLVEGPDLKEVIEKQGWLDVHRVLRLIRQAAGALDHAHERGMVHRDVKPQNFLIGKTEEAKEHVYLTDFGLVKPSSSESTASRTTDVFGSIQYMSPEQIEGMAVDGRADVYSLACVAFECLTGKPPFERPNEISLLWAHVHEEPPGVTDLQSSIPGGIDLVLRQAMSKHPDDRYLTCGELMDALDEGAKQHRRHLVAPVMRPLVKRIPRPKTEREVWAPNFFPELSRVRKLTDRANWPQVVGVTAVLCLFAAAVVQFAHPQGLTGAVDDVATTVGESVLDAGASIRSAFGGDDNDREATGRAASGERPSRNLVDARARGPARRVAVEDHDIPTSVEDRPAKRAVKAPAAPIPPGVAKLVFADYTLAEDAGTDRNDGELFSMRTDGTGLANLTRTHDSFEYWPDWSPDGSQIVYTRYTDRQEVGDLWVMQADGSRRRDLGLCRSGRCVDPEWSPDGRRIAFVDGGEVFIANLSTNETSLVRKLNTIGPSWSPDGRRLVGGCGGDMCVYDIRSGASRVLVRDMVGANVVWSPTGDAIAFEVRSGTKKIWVVAPDGSGLRQLMPSSPLDTYPAWSPDGATVAYSSHRPIDIEVVPADGGVGRKVRVTTELEEQMIDWWGPR